ncbi:AGE family epimerase/isomerase [Hirschia litorea]|uniref:AGE family epimerase/isomerase n=1 Tax=Hirschia litorea TaxID=1199156 RepID=A0ABW2IPQ3_9PROT
MEQVSVDIGSAEKWAKNWLMSVALPYWHEVGLDKVHGGSFEAMNMQGEPLVDMTRRFRVQARQVYAFAHAYDLGWRPGLEAMRSPLEYMLKHCWLETGGWGHLYSRDGRCVNDTVDTYDQAFALLGLGWAYKVSGDKKIYDAAQQTKDFLFTNLRHPRGGFKENLNDDIPLRRANPHMHLFETAMWWMELHQDEQMADLASEIFGLFNTHFCIDGLLREYFNSDLSPLVETAEAKYHYLEPGHLLEWASLLRKYKQLTGRASEFTDYMEKFSDQYGMEAATGLVMNQCLTTGGAIPISKARLWPQTEYIRIKLLSNDVKDVRQGLVMLDRLKTIFLTVDGDIRGYWFDEVDSIGRATSNSAPASTLYHVIGALLPLIEESGVS